ncbi:DUF6993 domain-containing protein [Arthrobacter sp. N1]|uniref:DUF6993 domain-containing protein n=1 Tax=Arthrobacter sp. N1 TaxID=619291 RepID=UPI003BB04D0D
MSRRLPIRPPSALWRILTVSAALAVGVTACTAPPDPGAGPISNPASDAAEGTPRPGAAVGAPSDGSSSGVLSPEGTSPTATAAGDAMGVAEAVRSSLQALADGQDPVTRDQVRAAIEQGFADGGTVPERVEVSVDRTPTGLDVDAIQGAGLIGDRCVVGEVREGAVSAVVLPVLATGLCFVGDQR